TDTALWRVLHESPTADQSPIDYQEIMAISQLLRGNHYARKLKEGGRLIGLEPVRPDIVSTRRRADGSIGYRWSWDGYEFDLTDEDVFHVRGFGGGPLGGLSVIEHARESLGIALATDRAAASIFANGMRPTGVLQTELPLTGDQRSELDTLMAEKHQGAAHTGQPLILSHGMKWETITMKADDQQLLESRGWSVEEICRWFGVPPFMIGHNEKTTSWGTGIEQMMLAFLKFTLTPYLRRFEQAVRKQLLTPAERAAGLFVEFNVEGLLRADSQGRARFYQVMTQIGAMTRNEVRAKENLPPIAGGDEVTIQAQYVPLADLLAAAGEAQRN
ncbi:MAG: phage portal protein, partial [Burkholderiaceae bacterium]